MRDGDQIESIQFKCDDEYLYNLLQIERHDSDKSITRYRTLCSQRLAQEYGLVPEDCRPSIHTQINGRSDHVDVEYVELIITELAESDVWKVPKGEELWTIREAWEKKQFTVGIARWACTEGRMSVIKQVESIAVLNRSELERFFGTSIEGDIAHTIWEIQNITNSLLHLKSLPATLLDVPLSRRAVNYKLLLTHPTEFGAQPLFSDKCSYIQVSSTATETQITVSLFADTGMWKHPSKDYTFSRYVQAFSYEAKKLGCPTELYIHPETNTPSAVDITCSFPETESFTLRHLVAQTITMLHKIYDQTELRLAGGPTWKDIHITQEKPFRDDILNPLFDRMFDVCRPNHGNREFGKDFILALKTKVGILYGAVQAKAGDIDSSAGGKLDQVLNQLDDAFSIPFKDEETGENRFISFFIIATSGKIREDAKEKLWWKILRMGRLGTVRAWDRETLDRLIKECFLEGKSSFEQDDWNLKLKILQQ